MTHNMELNTGHPTNQRAARREGLRTKDARGPGGGIRREKTRPDRPLCASQVETKTPEMSSAAPVQTRRHTRTECGFILDG